MANEDHGSARTSAPVDAPRIDVRSAGLEQLFADRLNTESASNIDPWPAPPRRFEHYDFVNGVQLNILDGLVLHCDVLRAGEQRHLLKFVERLREIGASGGLVGRTYSAPSKWRKGNGRVTVQMGCCYNYAGFFADGRW